MSKRVEAKDTYPNCDHQIDFTLYRSIWGEYPENRDLVKSDKINFSKCPCCNRLTTLQFPFIYINADLYFAIWWEPSYHPQIDIDAVWYTKMIGAGNSNQAFQVPTIKLWFRLDGIHPRNLNTFSIQRH
jgi:hypothetical protein